MNTASITQARPRRARRGAGNSRGMWVRWGLRAVLAAGGVFMLAPFVLMVLAAITPAQQLKPGSVDLAGFTLANFQQAWHDVDWLAL